MNGKPDSYWQTHMIGTEWIRVDFIKPTRITGLKVTPATMLVTLLLHYFKVQGSGQPGGKYFVKSFHIKVITPNGDIVPYQNCRAYRGIVNAFHPSVGFFCWVSPYMFCGECQLWENR